MFKLKIAEHKRAGKPICYLDESGHAFDMPRTHGYSKRGTRCFGIHDWGARGRVNVIGALIGGLLFAIGLFYCSIDSAVFGIWVRELLMPNLTEPTVIVMDNATFHKEIATLQLIRNAGHIIEFLPPYSPDLNPIEHKWAEKKAFRKKYRCNIEECYA